MNPRVLSGYSPDDHLLLIVLLQQGYVRQSVHADDMTCILTDENNCPSSNN